MGNCLKRSTNDDISLLHGGNEPGRESSEQLGPSPLYSVNSIFLYKTKSDVKHRTNIILLNLFL